MSAVKRLLSRAAVVLAASCASTSSSSSSSPADADNDGADALVASDLGSRLTDKGFATFDGRYAFVDMSKCCSQASCFGNNPASPYAAPWLGRGDGQTAPNTAEDEDGKSLAFRLRDDEAIVVLKKTPPRAKYFGYTLYLFDRDEGGRRTTLFASLGDTLNVGTIATEGGPASPFEQRSALVVTANAEVAQRVTQALVEAGLASSAVNVMPIPTPLAKTGLDPEADTFSLIERVALFEDADKGGAYVADPQARVLRVTPKTPIERAPYPTPTLRKPGTGITEAALEASLDSLESAILAKAGPRAPRKLDVTIKPPGLLDQLGFYCIEHGLNCNGDNHDTLYPASELFLLGAAPSDAVYVYGVNHAATGKVTYASFAVYDVTRLMGVVSVDTTKLAGSAADFVPGDPNVDKLYAWKIARHCAGAAHCVELPTGCPGVDLTKPAYIQFRTYLEPATNTSPDPAELVMDRAVRVY